MSLFKENKAPLSDAELKAASLAAGRQLTGDELRRVAESMRKFNLDFRTAAGRLGILTGEEPNPASPSTGSERPDAEVSLVELALHKASPSRQLVLKEGPPVRPSRRLGLVHDPYSSHSERIRALRTEVLLRCPPTGKANVIAVLSPSSGEGRSQLSAELALAFAQLGTSTLLVDADFRNPQQHVLFECENDEGLSQAVVRQDLSSLHRVEGISNMTVLTAGPAPPNPLELLSDGRFGKCMMRWRDSHQFVVLDTPPISRYSDALAVAAIAGRVLLLSRAKHTSYRNAKEMLRRLDTTQAEILGAVITHY